MDKFRELAIGKMLYNNKYIIEKVLGVGGFGITYHAKHTSLNIYCAIKEFFISGHCIRNTQSGDVHLQGLSHTNYHNFKQKFIEEAQTLAKLEHPNIVKVIDIFEENNTSYIVMPFVLGITLQQYIETHGNLNFDVAVNFIAQIAEAISYVHSKNILHRDIKPDNIIITPDSRAILIDFGSAREFIHGHTQSHTSILTKGYAPLEQYAESGKKGAYSDIYSIGAVLFYILTGKKPIDAVTRTMEMLPPPISLNPNVSKKASQAVMKAMEMKIEDRYQTVEDFLTDILQSTVIPESNNKPKITIIRKSIVVPSLIMTIIGIGIYYLLNTNNFKFNNQINVTVNDSTHLSQRQNDRAVSALVPIPDTTWLIPYNQLFTEASNYYNRKEYQAALRKYYETLQVIPFTDDSNRRKHVKNKIAECNLSLTKWEQEREKEIEKEIEIEILHIAREAILSEYANAVNQGDNYYRQRDFEQAKKSYNLVLNILPSIGENDKKTLLRRKINDCDEAIKREREEADTKERERQKAAEEQRKTAIEKQRKTDLANALTRAHQAFNANPPNETEAFSQYQKAKVLDTTDLTGYHAFMQRARAIFEQKGEYDAKIKGLLLKAQILQNTEEVRKELAKCP